LNWHKKTQTAKIFLAIPPRLLDFIFLPLYSIVVALRRNTGKALNAIEKVMISADCGLTLEMR
jgi:hypothetical protein